MAAAAEGAEVCKVPKDQSTKSIKSIKSIKSTKNTTTPVYDLSEEYVQSILTTSSLPLPQVPVAPTQPNPYDLEESYVEGIQTGLTNDEDSTVDIEEEESELPLTIDPLLSQNNPGKPDMLDVYKTVNELKRATR